MKKFLVLIVMAVFVSGCAHQFDLISRDNSGNGHGMAQEMGKQITIELGGATYHGTYVYDGTKIINSFSNATATAYSGNRTATAYGTGHSSTYIPGSGRGQLIATSGNDTIRCDFNYSQGSGIGYCQDNQGKEYDLIIH